MDQAKQKVLILGGGFGGIKTALELAGQPGFEVSLMSDRPNFRYYPMLYRAATGGDLRASSIPMTEIFADKKVSLINDSAQSLDRTKKAVAGKSGKKYSYNILVIALGVVTNYFGIKGLEEYAYGIKSVEEAQRLRTHLHKLLLDNGKPDLNYIVIGGGPTGVELAGALPGYLHHIMTRHGISNKSLHIELVEAEPRLLPRLPKGYSQAIAGRLKKLGIALYLGQSVQAETADSLMVNGRPIASHTVVWTAGVTNHPFFKTNKFKLSQHGKAIVDQFLQAEEDVYVIGDNADTLYSGMAQTALYDGVFLANNLKRIAKGKKARTYKPEQPAYIIPVGHKWAAVMIGRFHFYGRLGWFFRSAADFIAYHDLEPWWKARQHWRADDSEADDCPTCSVK